MDSNKWGKFAGISPETSPPPFAWGIRGGKTLSTSSSLSSQLEKSQQHLQKVWGNRKMCSTTLCDCACLRCLHIGSCQAMHAYPLLAFWFMSSHVCLPSASIFFCLAMHAYTMHCLHFFQFLSVNAGLSLLAFWTLSCNECIWFLPIDTCPLPIDHLCLHLCTLSEKQSKFP